MEKNNIRLNFAGNGNMSSVNGWNRNNQQMQNSENRKSARNVSWLEAIGDDNVSFYQQVDPSWYQSRICGSNEIQ